MNKRIATKWVAALRSGDYAQTYGRLRAPTDEGYAHCCLGVLCDLYKDETGKLEWRETKDSTKVLAVSPTGECSGSLPNAVVLWAKMNSNIGDHKDVPKEEGCCESLAEMNDHGYSFEEISTFIEKHWEDL